MTVEEQLRRFCDHLDAQQAPITTEEIIAARELETFASGKEPGHGGRRFAVVLAVAAAIVIVIAGWLTTGGNDAAEIVPATTPSSSTNRAPPDTTASMSSSTPSTLDSFPAEVPEAPYDPMSGVAIVTMVQRDGVLGFLSASGEFVPRDDLPDGALGDQRILDTASPGAGSYLVLCCDPGPSLWRNGKPRTVAATRIQFVFAEGQPSSYVSVDDVGDTVTVSTGPEFGIQGRTVRVPEVIDAAATAERLVALVAGEDPRLLVWDRIHLDRNLDETKLERLEVPLADQGPCSIVPVNDGFLVLYGSTDGIDRCIGDRAALIDGVTGDLVTTLRLPGTSRQLNSDGEYATVVTTDGRVLVGRFSIDDPSSEPQWTTKVRTDAVAASVGFS